MIQLKWFKPEEFDCGCGCGAGPDLMDSDFLQKLDRLRSEIKSPLVINSGYRCKKHNDAIKGSTDSFHMKGLAADISTDNLIASNKFLFMELAILCGFTGIGIGHNFMHVDTGHQKKTMWVY